MDLRGPCKRWCGKDWTWRERERKKRIQNSEEEVYGNLYIFWKHCMLEATCWVFEWQNECCCKVSQYTMPFVAQNSGSGNAFPARDRLTSWPRQLTVPQRENRYPMHCTCFSHLSESVSESSTQSSQLHLTSWGIGMVAPRSKSIFKIS